MDKFFNIVQYKGGYACGLIGKKLEPGDFYMIYAVGLRGGRGAGWSDVRMWKGESNHDKLMNLISDNHRLLVVAATSVYEHIDLLPEIKEERKLAGIQLELEEIKGYPDANVVYEEEYKPEFGGNLMGFAYRWYKLKKDENNKAIIKKFIYDD